MGTVGTTGRSGVPQDIAGAVTAAIVRCVRERSGDFGVAQVLAVAGERRPVGLLEDPGGWSTHDEVVSLLAAAERVTGDPAVSFEVGKTLLGRHGGTDVVDALRSAGSPDELLRNVGAAAGRLTTVSSLEALEVGNRHAVLRAVTRPRLPRHRYLCEMTKGMLSQVPAVFGLVPAVVDEPECQAAGGRCCLYAVTWEPEPEAAREPAPSGAGAGNAGGHDAGGRDARGHDAGGRDAGGGPGGAGARSAAGTPSVPDARNAAGAPTRRRGADTLLDGAARSAADVVAGGDLPALLGTIAARAAAAAGASRYLFVVGHGAGQAPLVHQAGLDDTEAVALARELLASGGPGSGGARLVVDVATARRIYGRLAAYYPLGEDPPPGAHRILTLHAHCAAAAVELATASGATRRSEETAEALVRFSAALSRAGSIADVAQSLADAVRPLARCERSSVLLWDPFEQRLVLQAWSPAGRSAGDVGTAPDGEPGAAGAAGAGHRTGRPYEVTGASAAVVPVLSLSRQVTVVDAGTGEPALRGLLERTGARCAVLVPLFSDEEFVGVAVAEHLAPPATDPRADAALLARLRGVADLAVVALQSTWLLEQMGPLAWHDSLTGLPNRRLLEHRAHRALEQTRQAGEATSMFFVDLDRFKRVNDTYGHATGDALIRQVAQRLREVVRRQDTVARLGGDEFAVVLPGLDDASSVREMAGRMLEALRVPYRVDGNELHTSASIGIAVCPDHGEDYDELLIHADAAMYRSKGLGRDTFTMYAPDAGPGGTGPAPLEPDIHHAVERGELFLVYQPTVDLRTNRVVGLEALVRWRHPERGVLEPGEFLALAEESEAIIGIDEFVLQEVARQVREWLDAGASPVRVSINASRRDLVHPRFADTVLAALRAHRLPPDLLEIEITEEMAPDDDGVLWATVDRLRSAGVRFAMDDFGAGSSSLQQLASLPVRTLKIDRSLVQLVGPADELGPLASAIIAAAAELGMECVAEGVETLRQRQSLLQRGCTTAQGYLYGRPLPPDGVRRLLQPPAAAAAGPAGTAGAPGR